MKEAIFLETAFEIGARLCRDALWHGGRCSWVGPKTELVDGVWRVIPCAYGPDLYQGTSGNALFLAYLYKATGEQVLRQTAEGALRQALSVSHEIEPARRPGFYTGQAGIAYACIELGQVTADERWTREGLRLLTSCGQEIGAESELDLVAGMAGSIGVLLRVQASQGGEDLFQLARRCGELLLGKAVRQVEGLAWRTLGRERGTLPLTGFSHGAAGIGWALLELFDATGEARFRDTALEGFLYERSHFNAREQNWPDFREVGRVAYPVSWCHGAAGIGFSRLRAAEILGGDALLRREAETALRTTLRDLGSASLWSGNFSLCHGHAGNAELLLLAFQLGGQSSTFEAARSLGYLGIAGRDSRGGFWTSGQRGGEATPNLMLGSAGTGYFYLRLYDPWATPPILILPRSGRAGPAQAAG